MSRKRRPGASRNRSSAPARRRGQPRDDDLRQRSIWIRLVAALLLLGLVGTLLAAVFAGGRAGGATAAPNAMRVEERTMWTRTDDVFAARVRLPPGHGEGELFVSVRGALAVGDDPTGADLPDEVAALEPIPVAAATEAVVVRIPVSGTSGERGPNPAATSGEQDPEGAGGIALDPGVYPIVLDWVPRTQLQVHAPVVTHLVHLPAANLVPRPLAIVLTLDADVTWNEGLLVIDDADRFDAALRVLSAYPDTPVVLDAPAAVLAALDGPGVSPGSATLVADLVERAEIANQGFVRLPAGSWVRASLHQTVVDQFAAGEVALTEIAGRPPLGTLQITGPTDGLEILTWHAARGTKAVVVDAERLAVRTDRDDASDEVGTGGASGRSPARRDSARPDGKSTTESANTESTHSWSAAPYTPVVVAGVEPPIVAMPAIDAARVGTGTEAIARLLAELSIAALEPGAPRPEPVIFRVDADDDASVENLAALLAALAEPGAVAAGGADQLIGALSFPGTLATAELRPAVGSEPADEARTVASIQADVASFASAAGANDPASIQLGRLALLSATASPAERQSLAATARASVLENLDGLELAEPGLITVTSHRADLPVTVRNGSRFDLDVRVGIRGEDVARTGSAPLVVQIAAGETKDMGVPVELRRSGTIEAELYLETPDGRIRLEQRTVRLRSTAISGLGVLLSVAALAFLALWWARSVRNRRRAATHALASTLEEGPAPPTIADSSTVPPRDRTFAEPVP